MDLKSDPFFSALCFELSGREMVLSVLSDRCSNFPVLSWDNFLRKTRGNYDS